NPATTISYAVQAPGRVLLTVHDSSGRRVAVLADGHREAGEHAESWDGRAATGTEVRSGVYFVRMTAGDFTATRKLLLLR
ncbi:MAG: FlgD immunoglobulin-like domain containing protein, partial [Candidatus Eisenbacteria bacterium]